MKTNPDNPINDGIEKKSEITTMTNFKSGQSLLLKIALALAIISVLTVIWQWFNTRQHMAKIEHALSEKLDQFNSKNLQSYALSKNADERSSDAFARTSILEQKLAESVDQQESLQALYEALANNHEERLVSEVEELIVIANEQLQLASNVKIALLALQTADSRLQQLDTPQSIQLRKSISKDIQNLQNLPTIDVLGISLKLDNLSKNIDQLPLISERLPLSVSEPVTGVESDPLSKLFKEMWQDIKNMVRIERIDRPEPPLLSPEQSFFLHENIKLHLLTSRIALLQHEDEIYHQDLITVSKWISYYFDQKDQKTIYALNSIKELSASKIIITVPDINETINLVNQYKLSLDRINLNQNDLPKKKVGIIK